ncbi:MAG: hypothetical protein H6709_20430 [Kofleriaceae bacterium]|nr:hypothetical protein [Kofleriaceae bacterium]MCB9574449.1 hypothetical protein [Kofleriaceae bacterium]
MHPAHTDLIDIVTSWYLRRFKLVRALGFVCVGLVGLVLVMVLGAALEGSAGIGVPLTLALVLGVPSALFARYAHRRVTHVGDHALVAALRDRPADVEIVERSWTIVPDLSVAGLLAGRKERTPCLRLRVRSSGKRYLIPMTDAQCDGFTAWLAPATPATPATPASQAA